MREIIDPFVLQKGNSNIKEALKLGLSDQDSETRSWARKAFWAYADHFKMESDLLLNDVERSLASGGDNCSIVSGFSTRSRQSSLARSNESLDSLVSIFALQKIFIFHPVT